MASSQPLSHPPAEGLRTRSDEGWGWFCALPAEPAQLPAAPLAAGVAVFSGTPRDGLLGNRRCHARLFLQADQGGPVPQAAECGPSRRPAPPDRAFLKELTQGQANSCRPQAPSGPAPGMRGVADPGPRGGSPRACFPDRALECSLAAQPTPAPPFSCGRIPGVSRASPRAFSTLPCQPQRARGRGEGGFYGNLTFCYFLFSFLWFLQL